MSEINFEKQIERALKAGEEANRTEARAVAARYDPEQKMIVIDLRNGGPFSFPIAWVFRLRDASDAELAEIEITPSGEGLHWEKLDEDLSVPGLINGIYGPERHDTEVLARLSSQLESEWFSMKDPSTVDRLAEANPLYAADLYEAFGFLIDSELDQADGGPEEMAKASRKWLEAEGLAEVHRIAEGNQKYLTTHPIVLDPSGPTPEAAASESVVSERGDNTSGITGMTVLIVFVRWTTITVCITTSPVRSKRS